MKSKSLCLPGESEAHLVGSAFASAARFRPVLDRRAPLLRGDYLVRAVAGRAVIHLGCADHLPLIDRKIADGTWLHARLVASAAHCVGFDINAEAIMHLRRVHARTDCHFGDLLVEHPPELAGNWDDIVLGELVEHVDDPVGFLAGLRRRLSGRVKRFLISVPSAWAIANWSGAWHGIETINSDHRYWFTPYTLAKVAWRAGFACRRLAMCQGFPQRGLTVLPRRALLRWCPLLRDTLIMTLEPRPDADQTG